MGREVAVIDPSGSTAVAPRNPESAIVATHAVELGTLVASTSAELIEAATAIATPLARLIDQRGLAKPISGRRYVAVEGWTTLAVMLGVTPHEVDVVERDGVFTATIELRAMKDGRVLARASAECGASDEVWGKRPRFARRSMALTRATGKACRLAFSWIMVLAGYEGTPAEEMDGVENGVTTPSPASRAAKKDRASTGQIDEIRMLLLADEIPADVRDKTNAGIAAGLSAKKADQVIARLKEIINEQLAKEDAGPAEPQTATGPNKGLNEAVKLYRYALDEYAPHLILDDDLREAFEERIIGRTSKEDWTITNFRTAIKALEAGEVELPATEEED